MSRITKWKLEKTKVKVVFRLQFHATHIPQPGWDKLFISFIPADSGKVTSKTTKANVRSGACKWADPIYETTRLLQDSKTKQLDDKFYKLVVAMGSSRSSVLGEAIINLAHYADALKPSVVALPLQGCDSGATLHVTVQLLTSKTGFREFELQRELRERGLQSTSDESTARKVSSSEDNISDLIDKVSTRVRFKEELPPLGEVGANEEYADSAVGFDGSSSASESLYAEKHDTSSTHEVESLKITASGDLLGPSLSQSPQPEKGDPSDHRFLPHRSNEWAHHGWGSDYSADIDMANVYEENSRLRRSLETAESSIFDLKQEMSSLQSHADEIGIEAQKFAQLLASELTSGEQLSREVSALRSECSNFKATLEQLKYSKLNTPFTSRETIKTGQEAFLQELQLRWLKGLLVVEDKIKEIQSKGSFGFHDRDIRSFNSDLEALRGVLHDLKQGTGQAISGLNLVSVQETREMTVPGTRLTADFYQPDDMLHCLDIPCLVSQEIDSADAHSAMKGKIFELVKEVDDLKAEREGLTRKMDQMECYYEALVQELEENQRQMMGELQNLRNEHSTCLYTISATKAEMENMHQDMNKQIILFSEEKSNLDSLNKDLERRALTAEAALKRARLNYSIAVNQLQKDLELLSVQVLSMYETNENLIKQAFSDSSQPIPLGYEEVTETNKLEAKDFQATKLSVRQNGFEWVNKQNLAGDIISEDLNRSLLLQKGVYQKIEEEVHEVHTVNVHLEIFSKTLQETLLEASAKFRLLKEKVDELTQQLALSTESKELLMLRLQDSVDEVRRLTEYKETCDVKCDDMALQNQVLETNFQNVTGEHFLLSQKINEYETLIKELRSYENKFQACSIEKIELENLLKNEMLEKGNLQNKVSSLQEEMKAMRSEFEELASVKENLQSTQSTVNFLHDKLQNLLASFDEKYEGLSICSEFVSQGLESEDLAGIVMRLEGLQHTACEKIFQLVEEKQDLLHERDMAYMSLNTSESDKLVMKHKFEDDVRNIMDKLDASSILVQKLQSEVDVVANRLKIISEAEETYAQQHGELLSAFDLFEVELEHLNSKYKDLAQEIMALDGVSEELGRFKLEIATLSVEKEALVTTLKDKNEESAKLEVELNRLRSTLQSLHDELDVERGNKSKLESNVRDLTAQLNEKHSELLNLDQQNAELVHLRQLVTDLELEKSSIFDSLSDSERSLKDAREVCSSISSLKAQISEMHEFSLASDIRLTFMKTQYESYIKELQKKCLNVESKLTGCLAMEADYIEENSKLMTSLNLLRSELDASIAQNRLLLDTNSGISTELDEFKKKAGSMEATSRVNTRKHAFEVERLEGMVLKCEEDIDNLMLVKEELEVKLLVFKFALDSSTAENRALLNSNNGIRTELNEFKKRAENREPTSHVNTREHALEVEQLAGMLVRNEEEIDKLMLVKEELEVKLLVLKFKLDEQKPQMALLEEYKHELIALQNKYDKITHRLSEQVLKTEEFKNLSIHLKELKDKADAECLQARDKREPEGTAPAMQESLRIVFIKEQYESKLQELKHQLSISKKHGEEILLKLQDAIDEVENRKKSEAFHLKRNEELGMRILELESDLLSALSEKRELMKAYDAMKAEKECSLISLECCKEELEASLQKCNEEKSRFAVELTSMKDLLERYTSALNNRRGNDGLSQADCIFDESVYKMPPEIIPVLGGPTSERSNTDILHGSGAKDERSSKFSNQNIANDCREFEPAFPTPTVEADQSNTLTEVQSKQDVITPGSLNSSDVQLRQEDAQHSDTKHLALVNDCFKGQSLKSSMDHLNKELEKMKHESLLLSQDDRQFDPVSTCLQRELMQLNKVNEELGSKFPLFNEFPSNGNALERVLALEMELAEALQEKNKSSIHFQSSFLKQHSDEEAVFKSFRDINELIKDMLEIKGRYVAVETELKEMHERYSQLSLQFAEGEGERQRLIMTLKNVRASKKVPLLNRSSTTPLGGPLS